MTYKQRDQKYDPLGQNCEAFSCGLKSRVPALTSSAVRENLIPSSLGLSGVVMTKVRPAQASLASDMAFKSTREWIGS